MELEDDEDGGLGGMDDDDDDMEADGDDDDDDEEDEDELDEDEFGDPLEMEEDAFDEVDPRSAQSEFGGVEMLVPRRSFRGARNVETVKDCEWIGGEDRRDAQSFPADMLRRQLPWCAVGQGMFWK
jgi:nuclear receptor interaction protein